MNKTCVMFPPLYLRRQLRYSLPTPRSLRHRRDGDGQIGVDALDAHRGHHRHKHHHDRDHESADDKSGHKGWFEAIDNDKDGTISPEEWQTAATRWHHRHGAGHDTNPAAAHPDDA